MAAFRNERGQELLDLTVCFLSSRDNALLSHKDRTRIISEERRDAIGSRNGLFQAIYLPNGMVAETWAIETIREAAMVTVRPFEAHTPDVLDCVQDEAFGYRCLRAGGGSAPSGSIRYVLCRSRVLDAAIRRWPPVA